MGDFPNTSPVLSPASCCLRKSLAYSRANPPSLILTVTTQTPVCTMSEADIDYDFSFSIDVAMSDTREAPWYGVWNIILPQKLFKHFCKRPLSTDTFPQFPLPHDVDVYEDDIQEDADPDDPDSDIDGDERGEALRRFARGDIGPRTPARPPRNDAALQAPRNARRTPQIRDVTAPSPEDYKGSLNLLPRTPLHTPAIQSMLQVIPPPALLTPTSALTSIPSTGGMSAQSSPLSSIPASRQASGVPSGPLRAQSNDPISAVSTLHFTEGFATLETAASDNALDAVRKRMRQLNPWK
jgi:hypothetical protein